MKFLDNPKLIGPIALAAVALIGWQLWHPHGKHPAAATVAAKGKPAAPAVAAVGQAATNFVPAMILLGTNIDRNFLSTHWNLWLETPPRDPFLQVLPEAAPVLKNDLNRLKLKAIWRQSGVAMAAINRGTYRQGDQIDDYRIEKIEDTGVWLQSQEKHEFLLFAHLPPPETGGTDEPPAQKPK